jgi:hypothetical protein
MIEGAREKEKQRDTKRDMRACQWTQAQKMREGYEKALILFFSSDALL